MNVSLTSLTVNNFNRIPFISDFGSTKNRNIVFNLIRAKKFSSNFFYSHENLNKISFYNSKFSNFIERPILIDSQDLNKTIFSSKQKTAFSGNLNCFDSVFTDCQFPLNNGGAIFSTVPTKIMRCSFRKCTASTGAAIFCESNITIRESFFQYLFAKESAIFINKNARNVKFYYDCISKAQADESSILGLESPLSKLTVDKCNTSSCETLKHGSFMLILKYSEINYLIQQRMHSDAESGLLIAGNESLNIINNCVFTDISSECFKNVGFIISVINNQNDCNVIDSTFMRINLMSSSCFFVSHESSLYVSGCCFDQKNLPLINGNVKIVDSKFQNCKVVNSIRLMPEEAEQVTVSSETKNDYYLMIAAFMVFFAGFLCAVTFLFLKKYNKRMRKSLRIE